MYNEDAHMNQFIQYLDSVYNNYNQHLLEQGKKRDQVITFYIVLLSFVLTNFNNLDTDFFGKPTQIAIYIVLVIIGGIVLLNLADLRSWHTQYLDVIYVINWTMSHYPKFSNVASLQEKMKDLVTATLNTKSKPKLGKGWIKFCLFSSTDNTIYTGMIFLTSLPLLGVYSQIVDLFKLHWGIQIGIIIYIICLILMLIIFERHLNTVLQNGERYNTWILSFDYNGKLTNHGMGK